MVGRTKSRIHLSLSHLSAARRRRRTRFLFAMAQRGDEHDEDDGGGRRHVRSRREGGRLFGFRMGGRVNKRQVNQSQSVSQSLELRFRDSPTFRSGHFAEPPAMQLERFVAKYLLSPRAFWGRYSVRLGCREARGERIYF